MISQYETFLSQKRLSTTVFISLKILNTKWYPSYLNMKLTLSIGVCSWTISVTIVLELDCLLWPLAWLPAARAPDTPCFSRPSSWKMYNNQIMIFTFFLANLNWCNSVLLKIITVYATFLLRPPFMTYFHLFSLLLENNLFRNGNT